MPRRRKNSKKRIRKLRNRGPRRQSKLPFSAVRNSSTVGANITCVRNLQLYPTLPAKYPENQSSWLDKLLAYGCIAMKLFAIITSETRTIKFTVKTSGTKEQNMKVEVSDTYVLGTCQSIWIGVEDLIKTSRICQYEVRTVDKISYQLPFIRFRQGKLSQLTISISPGSPQMTRAGRVAACILTTAEDEVSEYKGPAAWTKRDDFSFADIVQMPGSVVMPYGQTLQLHWKPTKSSLGMRFLPIGQEQIADADANKPALGGTPLLRVVVGYQDYASASGSFNSLYAANEALVHLDLSGRAQFREPGKSYIRPNPATSMDVATVKYGIANKNAVTLTMQTDPLSKFSFYPTYGGLFYARSGVRPTGIADEAMAL